VPLQEDTKILMIELFFMSLHPFETMLLPYFFHDYLKGSKSMIRFVPHHEEDWFIDPLDLAHENYQPQFLQQS
jgi:hypothetical protein